MLEHVEKSGRVRFTPLEGQQQREKCKEKERGERVKGRDAKEKDEEMRSIEEKEEASETTQEGEERDAPTPTRQRGADGGPGEAGGAQGEPAPGDAATEERGKREEGTISVTDVRLATTKELPSQEWVQLPSQEWRTATPGKKRSANSPPGSKSPLNKNKTARLNRFRYEESDTVSDNS